MAQTYIIRQGSDKVILGNDPANASLLLGAGTSTNKMTTATANTNFIEFRCENTATSGDNRLIYNRLYLGGAGGGGESLRAFTTVNNVAAGTAHGAHISLNFGTSGTVTGQGIAGRFTLHIPSTALTSNVTMSAVQAEIWSDAATSDPGGSTKLSCFRAVNAGNATGMADVDDDCYLFDLQGWTAASGNMFYADVPGTLAASVRILVGSTPYYIPLYSAQDD
jgi:hypothetical protein